ncbi:MAG: radical SAM protein [Candidatus Omnitrophota bacterium]
MKIVIANSIGVDKNGYYIIHSPSRWSEGVKNKHHWFAYYPWELAYLSGLLKRETKHDVRFLDGCLEKLDLREYYKRITAQKPDILVMESATRMIDENIRLAVDIKKALGTKLIFVGQHASVFPEQLIEKGIDYVCVGEYEYTVLEIVQGKLKNNIPGLYPNERRPLLDINDLPWPEDEDVSRLDYARPGEPSSEFMEIQMYGSRGCPMTCNFCVARHIYYNQPNWRPRKVKDIIAEIKYLKTKYPAMEGVFFDEEAHNGKKEFLLELCSGILAAGLEGLHYEAMCDVRFLDRQVLAAMQKAGYYKIRVGIETASENIMRGINKIIDINILRQRLSEAKELGIKTYGTFTFGALGSTEKEDTKTIVLIKDLIENNLLDNLQVSICTPAPGTPFFDIAQKENFLRRDLGFAEYDGGNFSVVNYPGYDCKKIQAMKNKAVATRDHFFLKSKIKNRKFSDWSIDIYQRYGIIGFFAKAWRRLLRELRYQIWR